MNKYVQNTKLNLLKSINYRHEIGLSVLASLLIFAGKVIFWKAVFHTQETVNGFNMEEMILYFLIGQIVTDITFTSFGTKISRLVIDGTISNLLLKPLRLRLWFLTEEIGNIIFRMSTKLVVYIPIYLIMFGNIDIKLRNIPLFIVALVLSFLLTYSIYFIVGLLAFWFEDIGAINVALRRGVYFLAGAVIPLSFLPKGAQEIIDFLPFKYIFDFPVSNLTTGFQPSYFIKSMLIQIIWILVFTMMSTFILKQAIKTNESVGI
jgi:ABC-2 type transport system permease protein